MLSGDWDGVGFMLLDSIKSVNSDSQLTDNEAA